MRNPPKLEMVQRSKQFISISHVIKDPVFGEFHVKKSANAWWEKEVAKVYQLLAAFKYDYNIKEACLLSGISREQWVYFNEVHPEFREVCERCRLLPVIRARKTMVESLGTNWRVALWYLERKRPEEFGNLRRR